MSEPAKPSSTAPERAPSNLRLDGGLPTPKQKSAKRLRVCIVAPSLRYVGGQSAQADLLFRHWQNDPDIDISFLAVDPPLPRALAWAEGVPGLRTILREPIYFWHLWRGLKDVDVAHIFSASYWSFLLAPAPAWLFANMKTRGSKTLINYHSGEVRDHMQRFRSAAFVLSRVDKIVVPSGYLVDVFREFGLPVSAVPNIVDLSQFRYRERTPLRPHLICTRDFSRYYSVDVTVRAFAEVKKGISRSAARFGRRRPPRKATSASWWRTRISPVSTSPA